MAYFDCIVGGSGKGNTLVVTCADDLAGATITCTNGTKTYNKTCPSTSPYEVTFYGLEAGTWTVSATVSGSTYTATVVITDYEAELGGFSWRAWVDTAQYLDSTDYASLSEVLADEEAVRELCLEHACVDYLAAVSSVNADVETIINNDLFAKWVNNSDYSLDVLGANVAIKALMDTADKYGYGEWCLMPQVPTMTSNSAPYGEAYGTNIYDSRYDYFHAFDDLANSVPFVIGATDCRIGYKFISSVAVNQLRMKHSNRASDNSISIYGYNGTSWSLIGTYPIQLASYSNSYLDEFFTIENNNKYLWYEVRFTKNPTVNDQASGYGNVNRLQFYAWQPKGNVPIMTANNAPYGVASASSEHSSPYAAWKAFNGSVSSETDRWSAASGTVATIGYHFTNPICVKSLHLFSAMAADATCQLKGSNDGNNYVNIGTQFTLNSGTKVDISIANTEFYLYYQLEITCSVLPSLWTLQFYGRELSVSVPKMATNTTPYGEAFARDVYENYYAFNAFDDDFTKDYHSTVTAPHYLGYKSPTPFCLQKVTYMADGRASGATLTLKVQGSNDNFVSDVHDLHTETITIGAAGTINIINVGSDTPYLAHRVYTENGYVGASAGYFTCRRLQFYGFDYSEKEFEEGSTKKWLYDHGVELETIQEFWQSGGVMNKKSSSIFVQAGTGSYGYVGVGAQLDLSSYNLLRVHNIQFTGGTPEARIVNTDGAYIGGVGINSNNSPYNIGLDISNINQEVRACANFIAPSSGTSEFNEFWLE